VFEGQEYAPRSGTIESGQIRDLGYSEGGVAAIEALEDVEPLGQGQYIGVLACRGGAPISFVSFGSKVRSDG